MAKDLFEEFDIRLIDQIPFENEEMPSLNHSVARGVYRLTKVDVDDMPPDGRDLNALRLRLSELFNNRFQGYAQMENLCDIKRDTFQKILKFKNGRNVTYDLLAKFCIGAQLSPQEAIDLFALTGYLLNGKNRADYILLCELKNKGSIEDYDSNRRKYGYSSIISEADNLS